MCVQIEKEEHKNEQLQSKEHRDRLLLNKLYYYIPSRTLFELVIWLLFTAPHPAREVAVKISILFALAASKTASLFL